jgi:hypothetical protein
MGDGWAGEEGFRFGKRLGGGKMEAGVSFFTAHFLPAVFHESDF